MPTFGTASVKYVENVIWAESGVVFVAINLPGGSNNDQDVWYGAPTMSAAQSSEISERTGADLRWLETAFQIAQEEHASGLVIQAQADMWDNEKGPSHQAAFEPYVKAIAAHTLAFGKPVLMLNGDSHEFQSSNPSRPTTAPGRRSTQATTCRTSTASWCTAARYRWSGSS